MVWQLQKRTECAVGCGRGEGGAGRGCLLVVGVAAAKVHRVRGGVRASGGKMWDARRCSLDFGCRSCAIDQREVAASASEGLLSNA